MSFSRGQLCTQCTVVNNLRELTFVRMTSNGGELPRVVQNKRGFGESSSVDDGRDTVREDDEACVKSRSQMSTVGCSQSTVFVNGEPGDGFQVLDRSKGPLNKQSRRARVFTAFQHESEGSCVQFIAGETRARRAQSQFRMLEWAMM